MQEAKPNALPLILQINIHSFYAVNIHISMQEFHLPAFRFQSQILHVFDTWQYALFHSDQLSEIVIQQEFRTRQHKIIAHEYSVGQQQ